MKNKIKIKIKNNITENKLDRLDKSADKNINYFKSVFKNDETLTVREIKNKDDLLFFVLFIEGMNDAIIVNENLIKPIIESKGVKDGEDIVKTLQQSIITANSITRTSRTNELISSIIAGDTVLLIDGVESGLIIESKGWEHRGISEPDAEKSLKGPREGFVESLIVNLTLIRRRINNPNLKFEMKTLGKQANNRCCICYIEGIAQQKIIDELKIRLDKIDIDATLGVGYIQELIKDSPLSPFETIGNTERPDVVAAKLLEGRIVFLLDGSPIAATLPFLFMEYFQYDDDYFTNFIFGSFNRILRVVGVILSIGVPGLVIALANFHQELIPTPLILSISAARQGVPFPTVLETICLIIIFEILREAATRMPTFIGQTISIVGALVLGQAAVEARLVSAPVIIVVGVTGITSLLVPKMLALIIVARFILIISASILGLYGYVFAVIGFFLHMFQIRSFGVPYMLSSSLLEFKGIKDTYIRAPWWYMKYRPHLIASKNNMKRQSSKGDSK